MSVSGLCSICESEPASERCDRCGAVVCSTHYDAELGYCLECAQEVRRGGVPTGNERPTETDGEGSDTYQF